jgi:hypothetical protein
LPIKLLERCYISLRTSCVSGVLMIAHDQGVDDAQIDWL